MQLKVGRNDEEVGFLFGPNLTRSTQRIRQSYTFKKPPLEPHKDTKDNQSTKTRSGKKIIEPPHLMKITIDNYSVIMCHLE